MLDPSDLYDVDEDVARLVPHGGAGTGPVLVHALRGFMDAGHAGKLSAEHLLSELGGERLVTFDVDQLVDYRSRRPTMTFDSTTWSQYEDPELAVDLLRDDEGRAFLLLHGLEPDVQWERYVAAVRQLVERFDVPLTVGVYGVPMGIPHTRPTTVTAHATRPALVTDHPLFLGTVQVPASAGALLELRLGQSGHDAMGFAVHVPHYLAQAALPDSGIAALREVERATGLSLRVAALEPAAVKARADVDRQVEQSGEVAALVHALEEQYDAFIRGIGRTGLLAGTDALPTADELGAEFERFLAAQQDEGPSA